jgi:hypothetical protein
MYRLTKEAITRYISSSHFQFNSIVRSRGSGIFCLVLFQIQVDLGEIGLCPHSRIYP